jgi:hypothetical protein
MQKFLGKAKVEKRLKTPDLSFQENIKSEKIKFSLFLLQEYVEYCEVENRDCLNRFQRQVFVFILKTLNLHQEYILKKLGWSSEVVEAWRQEEDLNLYFKNNIAYKLNIYQFIFSRLLKVINLANDFEKRFIRYELYKLLNYLKSTNNGDYQYLYREIKIMLEYSKGKNNLP